jgi:hypothetical protein
LKELKKHQFGGSLIIESTFFSKTVYQYLMLFVAGDPYLTSLNALPSVFNNLFRSHFWHQSPHGVDQKETWEVTNISIAYVRNSLILTFNCLTKNEFGELLSVRKKNISCQ